VPRTKIPDSTAFAQRVCWRMATPTAPAGTYQVRESMMEISFGLFFAILMVVFVLVVVLLLPLLHHMDDDSGFF